MSVQERITSGEKLNVPPNVGNIITVNFRQDTLFAVERDDGIFVAVKPISDSLGLNWSGQLQKIKDDLILSEGMCVVHIPSPGGMQETTCLKIDLVNGWLMKVDARRVKEAVRGKLLVYQRECHQVLFDAFYGKRTAPNPDLPFVDPAPDLAMKIRMVNACRPIFGNQAAGQLWFYLELPDMPGMHSDRRELTLFDYEQIKVEGDAA